MASTYVLTKNIYQNESIEGLLSQGDFRRATKNMCVAYLTMKACVEALGESWTIVKERVGAVLGTSHGELSATVQFLEELAKTNTARPLVFQSSLHNATLGFLAKQFGVMGPTLTVSDKLLSGDGAIQAAKILLEENVCDFCFVTGIDLIPDLHTNLFYQMYDNEEKPQAGAATLLLCQERGLSLLPVGTPHFLLHTHVPEKLPYDSAAIEMIAKTR